MAILIIYFLQSVMKTKLFSGNKKEMLDQMCQFQFSDLI